MSGLINHSIVMGFLFSSSKKSEESEPREKSRIVNVDMVQLDIKKQIRTIKEQKLNAENRANNLKEEAIQQRDKGNKSKAIFALKLKKLEESKTKKLDGMLITLEQTLQNLQEAVINKEVSDILKQGSLVIKELQKNVSAEDFQKIADDLNEQQQVNNELAELLGVDIVNEEMFINELNELEEEEDKKKAKEIGEQLTDAPTDSLPTVIAKETTTEEKVKLEEKQAILA